MGKAIHDYSAQMDKVIHDYSAQCAASSTSASAATTATAQVEKVKVQDPRTVDWDRVMEKISYLETIGHRPSQATAQGEAVASTEQNASGTSDNAPKKGKDVVDKMFCWVNKKVTKRYQDKIERTYVREEKEGHHLYALYDGPVSRADREQEKRHNLQVGLSDWKRVETSMNKWAAYKEAKKVKAEEKAAAKKQEDEERKRKIDQSLQELDKKLKQRATSSSNQA
ncbi:uncharacterized protein LOC134463154 [Engraulis encrasicolus]|uniref:uncharacterized protein LOC134463154 n=1 Tax=Engraulis encrasicolus TaxID=184585 RepID=UPI002FD155DE